MLRVVIVDQAKKVVLPKDLATVAELREAIEQAEGLIRECESLAKVKEPKPVARQVAAYFS
jgi:hypothetical protein